MPGGSSVVEALWATVVIGVGVLAITLLSGTLMRENRHSQIRGAATAAVEDEMERLLASAPLNLQSTLAIGSHPADVGASLRYEGLDAYGQVKAASVAAGASGFEFLRRWEVFDVSTARCLRQVRVTAWDLAASREVARAESYVNCP